MATNSFEMCGVCNEIMNDPKILPCAHSFCLKCLESSTTSNESPNCPQCQIVFKIPKGGMKGLKTNEFMVNLINLSQKCNSCKENQAIKFCVECSIKYCSSCLVHHDRMPLTSNHQLQPVKTTSTTNKINNNKYSICDDHSEEISLFCKTCMFAFCKSCITLKHKSHNVIQVSEFFDSVKDNLKKNLNIKEETLKNVVSNSESSEKLKYDNEMIAYNLKKQIQQRGEDVKKAVDSIVDEFMKKVDVELKPYQKEADDVLMELKNMKSNLNAKIETLKQQLNNLNYENVVETSHHIDIKSENISKYWRKFEMSLIFDDNEHVNNLEKMIGSLKKSPKLTSFNKYQLQSNVRSFHMNEDDLYVCYWNETKVDVFRYEGMSFKATYDFKSVLSEIFDLLIIDNMLFVSGYSNDANSDKIIRIDFAFKKLPEEIYRVRCLTKGLIRITKSICGNIIVYFKSQLQHLSLNGKVLKKIESSFQYERSMQLDEKSYIVCCPQEHLCIMNDRGEKDSSQQVFNEIKLYDASLAKDDNGYIYVGDQCSNNIFVLDQDLKKISTINCFKGNVLKLQYWKQRDALMVLTNLNTLLKFEL